MKPVSWVYVGAVILLVIGAAGLCLGGFMLLGSTGGVSNAGQIATFGALGTGVGIVALLGGIVLIVLAVRKTRQEAAQNVTVKVDLPGETKIEQMKCRSCGGTLTADNIKLVNGAPMVSCPFCNTVYQLTEEPKW